MIYRVDSLHILVLLASILVSTSFGNGTEAKPVRVAKVKSDSAAWGKSFVGSVQPARRSTVGTAVAGRVESVGTEAGDPVGKDAPLAQLRLTSVQIQLNAARADLEARKQELAELIAGPREEELRRLDAQAQGAKALWAYAQKRYERLALLSQKDATSQGDLDAASSNRESAEQSMLAATAEFQAANAGTRREQIKRGEALVARAEEEVNRINDLLSEHTIRAPFAGFVVSRHAEKGEWVAIGDPVVEVVELNPAEVRVAVPEDQINYLKAGQEVRIVIDAITGEPTSRENQRPRDFVGEVFRIVPDADFRSRSFPVRIRIANPNVDGHPLLKPGMLARVFLPVGARQQVTLVPQDALVLDRRKVYLFVTEGQASTRTVRRIEVETGPASGSLIQVRPRGRDRLSPGEEVVVEGNERLESGQAVTLLNFN